MRRDLVGAAVGVALALVLVVVPAGSASAAPGDSVQWGPFTYNTQPASRMVTTTEVSRTAPVAPATNWVLRLTTSAWTGQYDLQVTYRCAVDGPVFSGGNTVTYGGTGNHTLSQCGTAGPHSWAITERPASGTVRDLRGPWVLFSAAPVTAPVFPPGTSCVLSDAQIAGVARAAGFTGDGLVRAVAVALAESSGRVQAVNENPSPLSWDVGLWQINNRAHPSYDMVQLGTSPIYNANAAYAISAQGTNFSPWVAYNSGAYSRFLSRATTAVSSNSLAVPLSDCQGGTSAVGIPANPDTGEDCGAVDVPCQLRYLFVPSSSTYARFTGLGTTLSGKFPLSLLVDTSELLQIATNGCTSGVETGGCAAWAGISVATGLPGTSGAEEPVKILAADSAAYLWLADRRPLATLVLWLLSLLPIVFYVWRKLFPVVEGDK